MRWIAKAGVVCVMLACTSVVLAGEETRPPFSTAAERDAAQAVAEFNNATPETAVAVESTRSLKAVDESRPLERSSDGAAFRVDSTRRAQLSSSKALSAAGGTVGLRGEGCGDPESGDCFEPNGSPYCSDADCCETVCYELEEEQCCTEEWDENCAMMAEMFCDSGGGEGGCGDEEAGDCCEANWTPYCDDMECCEVVCYMMGMSWCCEEGEEGGWGPDCAAAAVDLCGSTCGPQTAACCFNDQCLEMEEMECIFAGGRWYHHAHCDSWSCPGCSAEDSLFMQNVSNWGTFFGTRSDLDGEYGRGADSFRDVQGDICGLRWVGTGQAPDGWECIENPMTFDIRFYEDNWGVPGAEACAYTVTVSGTPYDYEWFQYEVEFPTCCTLERGFVSIAGTGGPDCHFGWIAAEDGEGDGARCYLNLVEEEWECTEAGNHWSFDMNFCLLGTLYPGACCDEVAGVCSNGVEAVDCPETSRFSPGVTCGEMDPPCGDLAGACCVEEPPYCYIESGANCEGSYLGDGTTCDPNDCNSNGAPDSCDIAGGFSADCDGNGIPDECDIAGGGDDYDGNGVLDGCEADCNTNGVVDACDIACGVGNCGGHPGGCGVSVDCQLNGVPDECELGILGSPILWDNGSPTDTAVLRSHFGGDFDDALTVDDFNLPNGGIVNDLHWEAEESGDFQWQGFVHVFIFGANGAGGPDDANEIMHLMVPGDGGSLVKTSLGAGTVLPNRYRYDIYGLDIPLGPGIYWLGLAPAGFTGSSKWCVSQSGGSVIGGEAHIRVPSVGLDFFGTWTNQGAATPQDAAFRVTTSIFGADCNGNGIPDECDISACDGSPWCQDCQGNGMLDGCEPDCNANGVADQCDVLDCEGDTWCGDCDGNEIPDQCQVPPLGGEEDCNANGAPDTCDVADGVSPDCNGNGIPDECDLAGGVSEDYDGNGIPDECDPDCNENGVVDTCDVSCAGGCAGHPSGCGGSLDCQPDNIPDECQLSSDYFYITDDGTQDNSTGLTGGGSIAWLNHFVVQDHVSAIGAISLAWGGVAVGTPCTVYLWSDPNNDGAPDDAVVLASATTVVSNPDTGIFTTVDIADTTVGPNGTSFFVGAVMAHAAGEHPAAMDNNGWGTGWIAGSLSGSVDPNNLVAAEVALQPYVNAWLVRAVGLGGNDCNLTGIPDECDIAGGTSEDCDANGLPDECEWMDCNGNGTHDPCDLLACDGSAWCSDCNLNNVIDECDILSAFSADCHLDGVPDECQLGGSYSVLEETFYSTNWMADDPVPAGWESVSMAGDPGIQWVVTGNWGCDYEGGAVVWGNSGGEEEEEGKGLRAPFDVYLVSPEMTGTDGVLSLCSTGCGSGSRPWCDNATLDLMIVIGEVGGGDDIFVGSISDLWTGYFGEFVEPVFDLNGLLPGGPFRLAFRYHGDDIQFENVLLDQVTLTREFDGSDCDGNAVPDFCDMRDCDGSAWCGDCNEDDILDVCQAGQPGGASYKYDDGSSEGTLGVGELVEMVWIQGFEAIPGSETLVTISTSFGTPFDPGNSGVNAGDPIRVFVWDDPNNDGDPSDAVLLASATAIASATSIDTDVLQKVVIDPVVVSGRFFLGAAVWSDLYPAPMDGTGVMAHESWVTLGEAGDGGFDPTWIMWVDNMDSVGYTCNWLLRASSAPGPAPNDCNGNGLPDDCDLCGDLDMDGDVDYDDYVIFLDAFGGEADGAPAEDYCCDYDKTGAVGMADYAAWLECYRTYVNDPAAGPPVKPERVRVPNGRPLQATPALTTAPVAPAVMPRGDIRK